MTPKVNHRAAALVLTLGVTFGGAAMSTAPAAVASPIRDCANEYIAKGYTSRDAVQRCSRELTEAAEREAAERRAERRAERESTATTTRKPAVSVVKPTDIPGSNTYVSNQPRHWWDSLPTWTHGAMIGGALLALLWVIGYLVGKRAEVQERRQQAAEFAAGGGYDTAAAPDRDAAVDYPTDYPEDYAPPPEPQYHVPEQQTPPPAYAEQPQPEQRPQTPPPTTNSGGSSASAFDDLI